MSRQLTSSPPGRTPVDTRIRVGQARASEITGRLDAQFDEGGQAYWVCTLIEETEQSVAEAPAESRTEKPKEETNKTTSKVAHTGGSALPNCQRVHGNKTRMKADDKSRVMAAFAQG